MSSPEGASIPATAAGLRQRIEALTREITAVQAQLAEQLRQQPDHPDFQRLGPNCFSIPARCLDRHLVLDPFRYDWRAQSERLARHVTGLATRPGRTGEILAGILATQKESAQGRHYWYAPDVIERARPILEAAIALTQALRDTSEAGNRGAS